MRDFSSFPMAVFSLSFLYIVTVIASLPHLVIPSSSVILRSHRPKNLNEWLRINSAKNLVFVFRINPARQFEEINVEVCKK